MILMYKVFPLLCRLVRNIEAGVLLLVMWLLLLLMMSLCWLHPVVSVAHVRTRRVRVLFVEELERQVEHALGKHVAFGERSQRLRGQQVDLARLHIYSAHDSFPTPKIIVHYITMKKATFYELTKAET